MSGLPEQPITVLIAALGGEGGGVLSDWVVHAASASGYPVQGTSIPGVAQRTGATTYYIEIYPASLDELGERQPVFALTPSPGNVDIMVASELLEAGRAMANGFVTPERTTLIASTHRIYAIGEKSAMGDGRYDGERILQAAQSLARQRIMLDLSAMAREAGSVINAVLFGAMAGSGRLPLTRERCEAAIQHSGIAVEANLAGFSAGYAAASGDLPASASAGEEPAAAAESGPLGERVLATYPAPVRAVIDLAVARLTDYQDERYAKLFLEHVDSMLALDRASGGEAREFALTVECARQLALWMSYEDVIRVADLKTRRERLERVRNEVGAKPDEPVRVVEFLKPGLEELTSILPRWLARPLRWLAARLGVAERLNVGLHLRTTSISGFVMLWLLARAKRWRRRSARYSEEHALIARWLSVLDRAARLDYDLALEIAACARLIKGYGETHRRGVGNFRRIMDELVTPILDSAVAQGAAARVARAREAALADPDGKALGLELAVPPVATAPEAPETVEQSVA